MVDYWPQEEGCVFDADAYILPCRPDDAILEMSAVKVGTTVAGRISVLPSAAKGDGIGIALKAATAAGAPSRIPVLFRGIAKVIADAQAATAGVFAVNNITTEFRDAATNVVGNLVLFTGASYIMGMWLQSGAAGSDVLLLVGKTA